MAKNFWEPEIDYQVVIRRLSDPVLAKYKDGEGLFESGYNEDEILNDILDGETVFSAGWEVDSPGVLSGTPTDPGRQWN
jgi:hypothetical protein